ncbi:MAG: phosphatidate cytidylyltransferase [Lysobacterales bacterium]|jgi:phosphatidate cytidylyltransferase
MLKTRILTAAVLVPLAYLLIFMANEQWFAIVFAIFMVIGSWEFRRLGDMDRGIFGWLMILIQAVILFSMYKYSGVLISHAPALLTAACLIWLLLFVRLVVFRPGTTIDFQYRIVTFASSLATLSFAWMALYTIRAGEFGSWWILVLLLIIWSADTGAYFVGKAIGKRKLAPHISPSKTMAGFAGGLLLSVLVGVAAVHYIPEIDATMQQLVPLILITALVSVGGDLFVSLHKRKTGHKDSGNLFPGHGGVLDRFDSLLVGAPFFALGKLLLEL